MSDDNYKQKIVYWDAPDLWWKGALIKWLVDGDMYTRNLEVPKEAGSGSLIKKCCESCGEYKIKIHFPPLAREAMEEGNKYPRGHAMITAKLYRTHSVLEVATSLPGTLKPELISKAYPKLLFKGGEQTIESRTQWVGDPDKYEEWDPPLTEDMFPKDEMDNIRVRLYASAFIIEEDD